MRIKSFTLLFLAFLLPCALATRAPQPTSSLPGQPTKRRIELLALDDELQVLAARVGPSVVKVEVSGLAAVSDPITPSSPLIAEQRGVGSGIIVDPNGYILTNAHVIEHAIKVSVSLFSRGDNADGLPIVAQHLKAQIIGRDALTDIALLKVDAQRLPALKLANSNSVHVGQLVLAFGSPLGLENTVTFGVISAMHRQLNLSSPVGYLQTDASINPGNSGGPLVDVNGAVIGMNTMIASESGGSEGVGFSIPSDTLAFVYRQLRTLGHVRRGEIGVIARPISPDLATGLGLGRNSGIILEDVVPDSAAHKAGLRPGDVVLKVDGQTMVDPRPLSALLFRKQIGDVVTFQIQRGAGAPINVPVTIARRPRDAENLLDPTRLGGDIVSKLGIIVVSIDADIAKLIPPTRMSGGLLVVGLTAGGSASSFGLQAGDILYSFNLKPLDSLDTLRRALTALPPSAPAVLQIERDSVLQYLVFTNSE